MLEAPKHTLTFASEVGCLHKTKYSRLLSEHKDQAVAFLTTLTQSLGKQYGNEILTGQAFEKDWIDVLLEGYQQTHSSRASSGSEGHLQLSYLLIRLVAELSAIDRFLLDS